MTKHKIIGIITVILLILIPTTASALTGKVMQVKDGDTVVISPAEGGQFFICRLFGIDAPETARRGRARQPYGDEAARKLKQLTLGQTVDASEYINAEKTARDKRLGLWQDLNPTPPWEFRRLR
jgi:endonuclease YncB( thermonuclease family)